MIPGPSRCPRLDSNQYALRAQALNLPCMPIPPRGHYEGIIGSLRLSVNLASLLL